MSEVITSNSERAIKEDEIQLGEVIIDKISAKDSELEMTEDEIRLGLLGYKQEMKRIFDGFTNFGLTASMISVLLGFIPLYTFELNSGGPAIMFWSWVIIGSMTMIVVSCVGEICSAYPTMGALYFWAYRLGGEEWGPFSSWMAGWCNLLGQIGGVASGGYSGAVIMAEIINLSTGQTTTNGEILALYAVMLVVAAIVNTFAETMLYFLCFISLGWQIIGILVICIWMLAAAPKWQSPEFVFFGVINNTGFDSVGYVALVGSLAAASVFTGYDTAGHVAEETRSSHSAVPKAMLGACVCALVLGVLLMLSMNFCIQDVDALLSGDDRGSLQGAQGAYSALWLDVVGKGPTIFFLVITLVAIECSNCANLTSCARMIYSFSRDGALPLSRLWYNIDSYNGGPTRAIWLSIVLSFLLGIPGLSNPNALAALFSLCALGLYCSYLIPILLRITVGRDTFVQESAFNLGRYSYAMGVVSVIWCLVMIVVTCLPPSYPTTEDNQNYSPHALITMLGSSMLTWVWARKWFKGAQVNRAVIEKSEGLMSLKASSVQTGAGVCQKTDDSCVEEPPCINPLLP